MPPENADQNAAYLVVARKYRPQTFDDLIGQSQQVRALRNAIETKRIGHAYLFTGARGVGKTSTARIFSKALNCQQGSEPTPTPCLKCDSCLRIAAGDDIDVMEIDGASNRGIDEIRQLRATVNVRPSRSRMKIYIIDEVHMLTMQAFNALLKTLEEPPDHVKFIFCTTDPEKMPITVLSRCQRFDFAPVSNDEIANCLQEIADSEKVTAEPGVFRLVARRAAGSVRDSQSLFEQLLAYCEDAITVEDVHRLLGTPDSGRMVELLQKMSAGDTAGAITHIDQLIAAGVDPGQLAEQWLGSLRDLLLSALGCAPDLMTFADDATQSQLAELADRYTPADLLAMSQLLDQTLTRMRQSMQPRWLLELAAVRLCQWQSFVSITDVLAGMPDLPAAGSTESESPPRKPTQSATAPPKKKPAQALPPESAGGKKNEKKAEPELRHQVSRTDAPHTPQVLDEKSTLAYLHQALAEIGDTTSILAGDQLDLAIPAPNRLVITLDSAYKREVCERGDRKSRLEKTLSRLAGRTLEVEFRVDEKSTPEPHSSPPRLTRQQKLRAIEQESFVKDAKEVLDVQVEDIRQPTQPPQDSGGGAS